MKASAPDLTGQRFGRLVVLARAVSQGHGARWLCLCDCGAQSVARGTHLRHGYTRSCGCHQGAGGGRPRKPHPSYNAAHWRVRRERGGAREYLCTACCGRPAEEWAYDHADPDELRGLCPNGREAPYSTKPEHYQPLCKPCHARFDRRKSIERKKEA